MLRASVCIATYDRPGLLHRTLESIAAQRPPFEFEVIVIDDGSPNTHTQEVCSAYPVEYLRLDRPPGYRNPAPARNAAYRRATGEVIIAQSDEVIHAKPDTIQRLVEDLRPGTFVIATVINVDERGEPYADLDGQGYGDKLQVYTSPTFRRPLFFLGSLYRSDLYAVGGNDEEFVYPSREDVWFGRCLTDGLGLTPIYSAEIVGHHQHHAHCDLACTEPSRRLYRQKESEARRTGVWQAAGGPWPYP